MKLPPLLIDLLNDTTPQYVFRDAIRDTLGESNVVTVYTVMRVSGAYDKLTWSVSSFLGEEEADNLCEKLNEWCIENKVHTSYNSKTGAYGSFSGVGWGTIASGMIGQYQVTSGALISGYVGYSPPGAISLSSGSIEMPLSASTSPPTAIQPLKCPYDPTFTAVPYYGVNYVVSKVPLRA